MMKKFLRRMTKTAAVLSALVLGQLIVTQAAAQTLWVSDDGTNTIYELSLDGFLLSSFPEVLGSGSGLAIDVDPEDGSLWGVDEAPARVVNFTRTGELISTFTGESFGAVAPEGVGVADDGTLWIVDDPASGSGGVAMVFNVTKDGRPIGSFPMSAFDPDARSPQAVTVDPSDGTLWITDNRTDTIYNVSTSGKLLLALSSALFDDGATNVQGISVDRSSGTLWVTDRDTATIYNLSRRGRLLDAFSSTLFDPNAQNPTGIAFDGPIFRSGLHTSVIQMARRLRALPSDDAHLARAAEMIGRLSGDWLWETENLLSGRGELAFYGIMLAVLDLHQVEGSAALATARASHWLVGAAGKLASFEIERATAAGGDERGIKAASFWLHWGRHVATSGRPVLATYLFKEAWRHARASTTQ